MTIRHDRSAVRNAVLEPWNNGQTEGQINRLKTLKRSMYGRAGVTLHEILRLGRFFAFAAGNSETRTNSSSRICCKCENAG